MRFEDFAVDKDAGVWHTLENFGDLEVKLARWGNTRFNNMFSAMTRNKQRQIARQTLDSAEQERIILEVVARTVLLGWRNMEIDGEPVEYTWQDGFAVLDAIPELFRDIQDLSQDESFYRKKQLEDEAKNSETLSDGNSPGDSEEDS